MANAGALINEGLWRKDKEFQKQKRMAQCTFCQVLSQKDLDTAGVLTLALELLVKACEELTVAQLRQDFAELEAARFLFVDYDTDELFIRSYVRLVSVKSPNAWRSVPKNARMVASVKIRRELAAELRGLGRKDAVDLANEIDPLPTPSEPPPDPIRMGSERDNPSEPHREPPSQVPVLDLVSPSVGGSVGVRARRPRPMCKDHETDSDENCRPCMRRRMWDDEFGAEIVADEVERKRQAKAAAALERQQRIDACPLCDEFGDINFDDAVKKCTHEWESQHG